MLLNYSSHCSKCGGHLNNVVLSNNLDDAFERMAKAVYEGLDTDQMYTDFYFEVSKGFADQVDDGYKIDFDSVEYDSPDLVTRQMLKTNCFAFSGAKTFSEIQELQDMIIDSNGKYKTFSDFKEAAQNINKEYNQNWLKSEYNNAVNSSLSASQFKRYEGDKDLYPYLIYQTAGDSHVRPEHQRMDGIKRPVDDSFWDTNYPPNDWGCRCDVVQDDSDRDVTKSYEAFERGSEAVKNQLFKNNPGKSGVIFKDSHPYFKNIDGSIMELKAVDNYGLKSMNQIYADPNRLSKRLDTFKSQDDFNEWWKSKETTSKKFVINDNRLTSKLLADDNLKKKLTGKDDQWKFAKEMPVVIQTPDEVYSITKNFEGNTSKITNVYIKYYDDKPIVVVAESIKNNSAIRIISVDEYDSKSKTLANLRKGILMFKK